MSITADDCVKILSKCTKGKAELISFNVSKFSESAMGFMSQHRKLSITFRLDEKEEETQHFFVKCKSTNNANHLQYIDDLGIFTKEAVLFDELLVSFEHFFRCKFIPKNYLVDADRIIVLEDLCMQGYVVETTDLSEKHLFSIINCLAKFHACSIIYEKSKSLSIYDIFKGSLYETTFGRGEGQPRTYWMRVTARAVADIIMIIDNSERGRNLANKLVTFALERSYDYTQPSQEFCNTILHADLWRNNIMFKNNNGEINCTLVDFQFARYAPPAIDILTCLYINSSTEFFDKNVESLLGTYYEEFTKSLKLHGIDVKEVMNWDSFQKSIEYYRIHSLIEATFFGTAVLISDKLKNLLLENELAFTEYYFTNRTKYIKQDFLDDEKFRVKMSSLVITLMDVLERLEYPIASNGNT